jgi:hypothetical protein
MAKSEQFVLLAIEEFYRSVDFLNCNASGGDRPYQAIGPRSLAAANDMSV